MRFIFTIVWALILGTGVSYILSSMGQQPFNLSHAFIVAGIISAVVFLLAEVVLKTPEEQTE